MAQETQTGGAVIVDFLISQGVDTIFAISGAGNLAILDSLLDSSIRVVFSHHEQAAVMEAIGYSRVSGRPGVALVTTGGGTSNVVTGILSAHLDSVPVFLISGNESSFHCVNMREFRAYGVQGFDSVAVLSPITKSSKRVLEIESLAETLRASWAEMVSRRTGPVHVDVPMDIQRKHITVEPQLAIPTDKVANRENIAAPLLERLRAAQRPLFYFGQGLARESAKHLISALHDLTNAPYVLSWSAIDYMNSDHPGNVGRIGIYGDRHANIALQKADLIVAIGTRLSIPQVGYDKTDFGRLAHKFVVDFDKTELSKFELPGWETVEADAETFLEDLIAHFRNQKVGDYANWLQDIRHIQDALPRLEQVGPRPAENSGFVHSVDVMQFLNETLEGTAVIGTDVGAALISGHYALEIRESQRLFTSQGLGEMGFGLPGTLGAYFADASRQLVCLDTDGAMMFNLQELQLVSQEQVPLKLFVFNNLGYSMIKISQENLFGGRQIGSSPNSGVTFPDFEKIAAAFQMNFTRVSSVSDLHKLAKPALASAEAEFIEIMMDPAQKYLPRLATGKAPDGSFVSPPLEDLDPKIELVQLEELLGYKAHKHSYAARGVEYVE